MPSSIGRESTTITENRVPPAHASNRTFSTTDDLLILSDVSIDKMRMWSPGVGQHDIAIMNLLHCSLLNDLISNDNPISDVVVYFVAERILCLQAKSGHRENQRTWGAERTSCSGRSISEPLISNLSRRIALPIVTDIGRADTRWLICTERWVMRCLDRVLFGGVV
jgi:hypothetical protein